MFKCSLYVTITACHDMLHVSNLCYCRTDTTARSEAGTSEGDMNNSAPIIKLLIDTSKSTDDDTREEQNRSDEDKGQEGETLVNLFT